MTRQQRTPRDFNSCIEVQKGIMLSVWLRFFPLVVRESTNKALCIIQHGRTTWAFTVTKQNMVWSAFVYSMTATTACTGQHTLSNRLPRRLRDLRVSVSWPLESAYFAQHVDMHLLLHGKRLSLLCSNHPLVGLLCSGNIRGHTGLTMVAFFDSLLPARWWSCFHWFDNVVPTTEQLHAPFRNCRQLSPIDTIKVGWTRSRSKFPIVD
jgi:hypothetical protein